MERRKDPTSAVSGRSIFMPTVAIFVYLLALALGTHIREDQLPFSLRHEIVLHFCAYGGLTLLFFRLLDAWRPWGRSGGAWNPLVHNAAGLSLLVALALLDEATQPFTGRSFQGKDLLADLAGIGVALLYLSVRARRSLRRQ